jgi:hypothetical protein
MPPHHHHPPHPGRGPLHDKHGRPHHPGAPHAHQCLYNSEKELAPATIAKALVGFGRALFTKGGISLRPDLDVRPPNPSWMIVRFDRTAAGHDILKVELKWDSDHVVIGDSMSELLDELVEDGEAELAAEQPLANPNGEHSREVSS